MDAPGRVWRDLQENTTLSGVVKLRLEKVRTDGNLIERDADRYYGEGLSGSLCSPLVLLS